MSTKLCRVAILLVAACAPVAHAAAPVKTEVKEQGLVGDFFHTEGSSNKPGVLVLGGSNGGKPDAQLPELIAREGYPVLSLAYFKAEGLPEDLELIPLEYFDKALMWMTNNARIRRGGVVVIGSSKGAELALLLASTHPTIKGVVALAPSSVVWQGLPKGYWSPTPRSSWSYHSNAIPFVPFDNSQPYDAGDPLSVFKRYKRSLVQTEAVEKAAIEVEKIQGPVLLLSGGDDQLWPSGEMSDAICRRLKEKGFKYKYQQVVYDHAGHTMTEYYMLGGTQEGNQQARIDSARQMLEFLKTVE